MADSTGQVERPASRWRERLPVFLILVAVVIAGSFLAPDSAGDTGAILDVETDVAPTPAPSGAPTPAAEPEAVDPSGPSPRRVAGEWLEMAAEPTATYRGPSVWTGSELVVWGGQAAIRQAPRLTFLAEGAAYDPAGGSWRAIAASPLTPRLEAIAVWTGTEVLIWGGIGASSYLADGAAYNPAMDSWRPLAASPLAPRTGSAGIWTGTELLVIGGFDNFGMLRDGAAYDPVGDSWRPTADVPGEMELYGDLDGL